MPGNDQRAKQQLRAAADSARKDATADETPPPNLPAVRQRSEIERLIAREDIHDRFKAALKGFMEVDRFTAILVTLTNNKPELRNADPRTLLVASMHIAMSQLSPSPFFGEAWVVAFKNSDKSRAAGRDVTDAQFLLGYKGVERLALDSGMIKNIGAGLIYSDDDLDYASGTGGFFRHRSGAVRKIGGKLVASERDPDEDPVAAYAFAETTVGGTVFEVLPYEIVLRTREHSKSWKSYAAKLRQGRNPSPDGTPWASHPEAMARKTMVHRLKHQLPFSSSANGQRLAHALQTDGQVGSEIPERVAGLWTPDYTDEDDTIIDVESWDPNEEPLSARDLGEQEDSELIDEIRSLGEALPLEGPIAEEFDTLLSNHGINPQTWPEAIADASRTVLLAVAAGTRILHQRMGETP